MVGGHSTASGTLTQSFGYAFSGVREAFFKERNFRIQCLYLVLVLGLACWLQPDLWLAAICLSGAFLLLAAELANSSLERTVDLAVEGFHPLAKSAKDMAAGAVLLVSAASALVTVGVFAPLLPWSSTLGLVGFLTFMIASRGAS